MLTLRLRVSALRRWRPVAAALTTLFLSVCDSDRATEPLPSSVGNYTLSRAFDQPMPVFYSISSTSGMIYMSGTLELRSDGGFEERMIVRYDEDRATSETDTLSLQGRFNQSGARIEFSDPEQGFLFAGSVSDSTISYADELMTAVYKRQSPEH